MSVSYNALVDRIQRLLSDTAGTAYSAALLNDGVCHALDAILAWVPDRSYYDIAGDGVKRSFDLPDNFYEIEAVIDKVQGNIIARAVFAPGQYFGTTMHASNTWRLTTDDKITFAQIPTSDETFEVWYTRYWDHPAVAEGENPSDQDLPVPAWVDCALAYAATAYCLIPTAIASSDVRQWNTRVDSGTPEENPVMRTVDWLYKQFINEMNTNPRHPKATL